MDSNFKVEPMHLMPILASLLFGVFCAFLILMSSMEIYAVTPFPEGSGSFGNASYFVILVGSGALIFYLLLKRKNRKIITFLTGAALTVAIFMLSVIYLDAALTLLAVSDANALILILGLSSIITVLADLAVFQKHSIACDLVVLCLGGALGTFLGAAIPTLSAILILGFLAVYDVFAVYRGPVGKIAHIGLDNFRGLSFSFRDVQMGLGDLTFYSMLSGHMLLNFGIVSCVMSMTGILLGCLLAFRMLERKEVFPGLPFPILFGLVAGLLVSLI